MQSGVKLRDIQIRSTARILRFMSTLSYGRWLIERVGCTRFGSSILGSVLGYRRSFQTLDEAERAVKPYAKGGHENPANAALHLQLNCAARPSDYAAFYYLRDRMPFIRKVFDFGGNVGNLYYCYKNYLPLASDLKWTVYDLPENNSRGQTLASERKVANLQFTDNIREAGAVDLFIASGSLHYFDKPLPNLLEGLDQLPRYILINRTPLTEGREFAVVQDARHIRVASMIYNRSRMIADFERLGYAVLGEWQAPELRLPVADRPSADLCAFSGLWLEHVNRHAAGSESLHNLAPTSFDGVTTRSRHFDDAPKADLATQIPSNA
ncbi:methyltransferase, TIGR04325 family [Paraburkholderia azotifigens]|uniref:methyltransferase, TIGR04325 family n=1 Tax=Paraburkholderia azotifigens TaxID=2057004 RepID=UPI00316E1758